MALLRAGRFEVRIELPEPDLKGRRGIFEPASTNALGCPGLRVAGSPGWSVTWRGGA